MIGLAVRYSLRSFRRGGRFTVLASASIAIGVMTLVVLTSVSLGLRDPLLGNARSLNGGDVAVHWEEPALGQLDYFAQLKATGRIAAYTPAAEDVVVSNRARYILEAVHPAEFPLVGDLRVLAPNGGSTRSLIHGDDVAVTASLASAASLRVGDAVIVQSESGRNDTVRVAAIIADAPVFSGPTMLIDLDRFDRLVPLLQPKVGFLWVYATVPSAAESDARSVAADIASHFGVGTTTTPLQQLDRNRATVQTIQTILGVLSLVSLAVAGSGIANTVRVLLQRRRLEVAVLKTSGFRSRRLVLMIGTEAALLGVSAGLVGGLIGVVLASAIASLVARSFFITVTSDAGLTAVAGGVLVGLTTSVVFSLRPILEAGRLRPLDIIRDLPGERGWRRIVRELPAFGLLVLAFAVIGTFAIANPLLASAIVLGGGVLIALFIALFAGGLWLLTFPSRALADHGPAWSRTTLGYAIRNWTRSRVRAAITLMTITVGVVAVGLGMALGASAKNLLSATASARSDYDVSAIVPSSDADAVTKVLSSHASQVSRTETLTATVGRISAVDGRSFESESGAALVAPLSGPGIHYEIVQGVNDGRRGRDLGPADSGSSNAVLPLGLSEPPTLAHLGSRLDLVTPEGRTQITAVGFSAGGPVSLQGIAIYLDQAFMVGLAPSPPGRVYLVKSASPGDAEALVSELHTAAPAGIYQSLAADLSSIYQLIDNIILVIEVLASLALFGGLVGVANVVALSTLERRREIGIFKSVGFTARRVLLAIASESALLGTVAGVVASGLVLLASGVVGLALVHRPSLVGWRLT